MPSKLSTTGLAVGLLAAVIVGSALASTSSSGERPSATFKLLDFTTRFISVNPSATEKPGDVFIVHSILKTTPSHKVAGTADLLCTNLSGPAGFFHCTGTDTFRDRSTIELSGLGPVLSPDLTLTITGGTGRFAGAEGHVFLHSLNPTATKAIDTYTFSG